MWVLGSLQKQVEPAWLLHLSGFPKITLPQKVTLCYRYIHETVFSNIEGKVYTVNTSQHKLEEGSNS